MSARPGEHVPAAEAVGPVNAVTIKRFSRLIGGGAAAGHPVPPGHAASARSPPGPGVTGPAARHGLRPRALPGSSRTSRCDVHRPPTETRKRNMS
jgi:hypothetical protein